MKTAPGTFSRKRFPLCGKIAVTPVRMLSPRIKVVWPTATPEISVIAFNGPVGSTPTTTPSSRARGRLVSCGLDLMGDDDKTKLAGTSKSRISPPILIGEEHYHSWRTNLNR